MKVRAVFLSIWFAGLLLSLVAISYWALLKSGSTSRQHHFDTLALIYAPYMAPVLGFYLTSPLKADERIKLSDGRVLAAFLCFVFFNLVVVTWLWVTVLAPQMDLAIVSQNLNELKAHIVNWGWMIGPALGAYFGTIANPDR